MIHQRLGNKELALIAAIYKLFGNGPFDMPAITAMAFHHPELVAAIEAALPRRRWWQRDGKNVLTQSYGALYRLLQRLAKQRLIADFADPAQDEWYLPRELP
jgi:hypothetical protein